LIWAYAVSMQTEKISDKRHRFPPQIIAHVVWL
jgi:putative transposase